MTRAERIEQYLHDYLSDAVGDGFNAAEMAGAVIAIADDRDLLSLGDFSRAIGRDRTTIRSWMARGNVQVPEPALRPRSGALWDAEDIEAFKRVYPGEIKT